MPLAATLLRSSSARGTTRAFLCPFLYLAAALLILAGGSTAAAQGRYVITTIAGASAAGSTDGAGSAARFLQPGGVAVDASGTVYVADTGNATVRAITPAGVVTTIAGVAGSKQLVDGVGAQARFVAPAGIAVDAAGTLYVTDAAVVRQITSAGVVTTIAGHDSGSLDGTGQQARFGGASDIAVNSLGVLYIADTYNHTIRKITPGGVVTTLAGLSGSAGFSDGTGSAARFNWPTGITVDAQGTLVVADPAFNTVRTITSSGVVATLAGDAAGLRQPLGIAADAGGTAYVADTTNSVIRKITSAGAVTTLAGYAASAGLVDGPGGTARFNRPEAIAIDANGSVYIGDAANNALRVIATGGAVSTLAAGGFDPAGIAVYSGGTVYVADRFNHTIRTITAGGLVSTLAGLAGTSGYADGVGGAARFNEPSGIAVDAAGTVFVADTGNHTIRMITAGGIVTTLAGLHGNNGRTDGQGAAARFSSPMGIAVAPNGTLYVADTRNDAIRAVTHDGLVSTIAGGNVGSADGLGAAAQFSSPRGIAVTSAGTIYITDVDGNTVRAIDSNGRVTTVAGAPGETGNTDATGPNARFFGPSGIAVVGTDTLYIADASNNTIRQGRILPLLIPTVTVSGGPFVYDGTAHAANATVTGALGAAVTGATSFTYSPGGSAQPVNVGTYSAAAAFTSTDPDYANATGDGTVSITPAAPTLHVAQTLFAYDGTPHPLAPAAVGVNGVTVSGTIAVIYSPGGGNAPVMTGSYEATISFTSSDPNYTNVTSFATVTIEKGTPVIAVSGSFVYDGAAHQATVAALGGGGTPVAGTFNVTYAPGGSSPPVNTGLYTAAASFVSGDPSYNGASGTGSVTVTPALPNITIHGGTFPYDSISHPVAVDPVTGVGGIAVAGAMAISYTPGGATPPVAIGTYAVSVAFTSTDPNYASRIVSGAIVIGPPTPLSFSGTITAAAGQGIPGLSVRAVQAGAVVATTTTTVSGAYVVPPVPPGSYVEEVRSLSGALLATRDITLAIGSTSNVFNFALGTYKQTLYISPAGSDTQNGTELTPLKTFLKAFSVLMPGGELVLLDGIYGEAQGTGSMTWIGSLSAQIPSGVPSAPTYVHAKHPGSVVVKGDLFIGRSERKDSYIRVEGITFDAGATSSAAELYNTSFITIRNSGFHSTVNDGGAVFSVGTNDGDWGNTNNLLEDIWVWGRARGIAINYRSDRNTWRRVIVRGDGCSSLGCAGEGNPNVGITVYDSANVTLENVIVMDRVLGGGSPYADFAVAQHTAALQSGNNAWLGTISINAPDAGYYFEPDQVATSAVETLSNCVAWNSEGGGINLARAGVSHVENCTVKAAHDAGIRIAPELENNGGYLRNSLVFGAGDYGINSAYPSSYVDVSGTWAEGPYRQAICTIGCHATDPIGDGSLRYPVRIEAGSPLKGAGLNGADIGANVMFKYGVDGTRFGETGANVLTTAPLWPWPNEARIAADMCAAETRGFCSDTSLTHYIWNQLGQGNPNTPSAPSLLYTNQVMSQFPAAYWTMGESGGSVADGSGNGITGTPHGGLTYGVPGPFNDGTTAVQFNGSNSYFSFGDNFGFAGTAPFSFSFWMYQTAVPATAYEQILSKQIDGSFNGWFVSLFPLSDPSRGRLSFQRNVGGTNVALNTAAPLPLNQWNLIVGTYDGTKMRVYVNGIQQGSGVATTLSLPTSSNPFTIGKSAQFNANFYSGRLKGVAIVPGRALSQADVFALYATANTINPPPDYPSQIVGFAPGGYWRLGERLGDVADSSGNGITGAKHGLPTYAVPGPFNDGTTAIQFNGSNSYFSFGDNFGFAGTASFSFSFWMYQAAVPATAYEQILSKQIDGSFNGWFVSLFPQSDPSHGRLSFQRNVGGTNVAINTTAPLPLNQWNLIAGTYDGARMRLYVNGIQQGTGAATTLPLATSTNPFTIGKSAHYNASFFSGRLKDVAVLPGRALLQTEISTLYATLARTNAVRDFPSQVVTFAPGAYWRMGESGGNLGDSSGNGIAGVKHGSPTYGVPGGLNDGTTAVEFNGTNSYFTAGDNFGFAGTAAFSFAFWMYQASVPATAYEQIVSKQIDGSFSGWFVSLFPQSDPSRGRLSFQRNVGGTNVTVNTTAPLPLKQWNLIVGTYDGSRMRLYVNGVQQGAGAATTLPLGSSTNPFTIGKSAHFNAGFYSGRLKDVSVLPGRVFTQDDVTAFYAARPDSGTTDGPPPSPYASQVMVLNPSAYWRMGETSGDLNDTSGNSIAASAHGSPVYSVPGPLADGSTAVQFNGANSFFTAGDNFGFGGTASFSFAFWMFQASAPATVYEQILSKQTDGAFNGWFVSVFPQANAVPGGLSFQRNAGGVNVTVNSTAGLPMNQWNLIVGTYDGVRMRLYVNGVQQGTGTATTLALGTGANPFTIGKSAHYNASFFTGRLQDVAIVGGRALSQADVTALYAARP